MQKMYAAYQIVQSKKQLGEDFEFLTIEKCIFNRAVRKNKIIYCGLAGWKSLYPGLDLGALFVDFEQVDFNQKGCFSMQMI